MRCIAFLMAILVLTLSFFPCGDADAFTVRAGQQSETLHNAATNSTAPDEQDEEHEDQCTPFCHCSCCAGFSINHQVAELNSLFTPYHPAHTGHYLMAVREVSIPVWQPPQAC